MASIDPITVDLTTFWVERDPSSLYCLSCGKSFDDDALIRTFTVQNGPSSGDLTCSKAVDLPSGRRVSLFDRHLKCISQDGIAFAAVSHVWNTHVSKAQQQGMHSPQCREAIDVVSDVPIKIFEGFQKSVQTGEWEFWHDYFSVPQWNNSLKTRILISIHNVFSKADHVIFHLDDITPGMVSNLYYGATAEDRVTAVIGICRAKWYSRMWTAMELTRSERTRTMISDYTLSSDTDDAVFLRKLREVSDAELSKFPTVHHYAEHYWHLMRGNSVDWPIGLGPLLKVKDLKRTNFAHAFVTLSHRGCRDRMDFMHGLRGIVVGARERPLEMEFWQEFRRTARECLLAKDYSPLLITPVVKMEDLRLSKDPRGLINTTYHDYWTWELGEEEHEPSFTQEIVVDELKNRVTAHFQRIGFVATIHVVKDEAWHTDALLDFARCAMLTLRFTGPDLPAFIATLGTRLYGEDASFIVSQLKESEQFEKLKNVLKQRYDDLYTKHWDIEGETGARWLADVMTLSSIAPGFSESRLALYGARYGTMHCFPYDCITAITCTFCSVTSLFRTAAFVPLAELRHAVAFRIPGLKYRMSIANGMAFFKKGTRVVGRMLWATPACECFQMERVTVELPDFFPPRSGKEVC
ncbi:uncharacterized protein CTRU02_210684 [Colletotrichum truncatum]|uniref:Uncharacterized protein n=1 Tax=Colletotrichum truncatum TaxID=5467 RepID=A0ACC3YPT1_COLTU|nr:uncharacterized protein CTRU02_03823 [Colletotrichum truncatum]KAF6796845.1 hypothetical protein CTRU02_03823 [Colletotrichum truncatum]